MATLEQIPGLREESKQFRLEQTVGVTSKVQVTIVFLVFLKPLWRCQKQT